MSLIQDRMHFAGELGAAIGLADELDAIALRLLGSGADGQAGGEEDLEAGAKLLRLASERRAADAAGERDVAEEKVDVERLAEHAQGGERVVDGVNVVAKLGE